MSFCRSPLGLRGLKYQVKRFFESERFSRSPLGLRGLKSADICFDDDNLVVAAHSGCVD